MKVYIIFYSNKYDWEEQGIEEVFNSRKKAIEYLEQELKTKNRPHGVWEEEYYRYYIEEYDVK